MPNASTLQSNENEIESRIISLPKSYLNYLSDKGFNRDYCVRDEVILMDNFRLFPGIKIVDIGVDRIGISIEQCTLPYYCASAENQRIILSALQTLESLSNISSSLPANTTEASDQKKMAESTCKALGNYLKLNNYATFIHSKKQFFPVESLLLQAFLAAVMLIAIITNPFLVFMGAIISGYAVIDSNKEIRTAYEKLTDEINLMKINLLNGIIRARNGRAPSVSSEVSDVQQPVPVHLNFSGPQLWQAAAANNPVEQSKSDEEQQKLSLAKH